MNSERAAHLLPMSPVRAKGLSAKFITATVRFGFAGHTSPFGYREAVPRVARRAKRGGEGGIRTPDRLAPMPHFECGAFNHSATSPWVPNQGQRPPVVGAVF